MLTRLHDHVLDACHFCCLMNRRKLHELRTRTHDTENLHGDPLWGAAGCPHCSGCAYRSQRANPGTRSQMSADSYPPIQKIMT